MTDVLSRLARIEERGLNRDEKLNQIAASQSVLDEKIDKLTAVHLENIGKMKAHKIWIGGLSSVVGAVAGTLAGFMVKYFPGGIPSK